MQKKSYITENRNLSGYSKLSIKYKKGPSNYRGAFLIKNKLVFSILSFIVY